LKHLPADKQNKLDALMSQNNESRLTQAEARKLHELVGEAEEIAAENARVGRRTSTHVGLDRIG
jgi:hypothetical protein